MKCAAPWRATSPLNAEKFALSKAPRARNSSDASARKLVEIANAIERLAVAARVRDVREIDAGAALFA
jgi:hypothetical protein